MRDAIVLDGVRRSFGKREVLRGVTGRVAPGKVVGLLGRNGEGKSTLFKAMLDILAADSGVIEVAGVSPDGSGRVRQLVGYVPERPNFHSFMSVGEVLSFRKSFFSRWNQERALSLCKRLGLSLSENAGGASKGTLGKLAWACAAAHEPEVYLLDEPTSGLDALIREDILEGLIDEIQSAGRTILIANHHMEELAGILDEVWVMKAGRVDAAYSLDALRSGAVSVSGRLVGKAPAGVVEVSREGPLVSWAAFDSGGLERIKASRALENLACEPLPVASALRLLLKEESHVA
jgi:ABC-2 type transport system ATP-binding protein